MLPSPDKTARIAWIAADWGTTNLRLWAMDNNNAVVDEISSADGMSSTTSGHFERLLTTLAAAWLTPDRCTPVYACGMVGARQGWIEAPYARVPCAPAAVGRLVMAPTGDPRISVAIAGGVSQDSPPDVMRGEETQIAGFLRQEPSFSGVIGLPGTHCKWVQVAGGKITGFRSWMTGELFSLLADKSVLRHSVAADTLDVEAFKVHVGRAVAQAQPMADLFSVRARDLLEDRTKGDCRAHLSAILVAAEVRSVLDQLGSSDVVLLGAREISSLYLIALQAAGIKARRIAAERMTLLGLTFLREQSAIN